MNHVEKEQARAAAVAVAASMGFELNDLLETEKANQAEYIPIRETASRLA